MPSPETLRVRAVRMGYYDHVRRRVDDVFTLRPYEVTVVDPKTRKVVVNPDGTPKMRLLTVQEQFSVNWMEPVEAEVAEKVTTGKQALKKINDELLASKRPSHSRD